MGEDVIMFSSKGLNNLDPILNERLTYRPPFRNHVLNDPVSLSLSLQAFQTSNWGKCI